MKPKVKKCELNCTLKKLSNLLRKLQNIMTQIAIMLYITFADYLIASLYFFAAFIPNWKAFQGAIKFLLNPTQWCLVSQVNYCDVTVPCVTETRIEPKNLQISTKLIVKATAWCLKITEKVTFIIASEALRLHIEWTKGHENCQKRSIWTSF